MGNTQKMFVFMWVFLSCHNVISSVGHNEKSAFLGGSFDYHPLEYHERWKEDLNKNQKSLPKNGKHRIEWKALEEAYVTRQVGIFEIEDGRRDAIMPNDLQYAVGSSEIKESEATSELQVIEDVSSTTTTEVPIPYPPLNRRYRRIYQPDETASVFEFPFMAAVLVNGELWCAGVLIDSDSVVTAAHCLQLQYNNRFFREYVKMLSVRVGSDNATAGGELLQVTEIYFHPNYKPKTLEFNIAVLKLNRNLTLGRTEIDSIIYSKNEYIPNNKNVLFLGWGSVVGVGRGGDILLQKIELPVYPLADCQDIYGRDLVTRHNFCAGYITQPKNVCNHDAGGPAILDSVLIGILSFSAKRCDQPDTPAVFTKVGDVVDWLASIGAEKPTLPMLRKLSMDTETQLRYK